MDPTTMHPGTKASRVLDVLREGDATCSEIAAELELSVHLVSAHLHDLVLRKKIIKKPFETGDKRKRNLYSLALQRDEVL